jgi:hypothetical protein
MEEQGCHRTVRVRMFLVVVGAQLEDSPAQTRKSWVMVVVCIAGNAGLIGMFAVVVELQAEGTSVAGLPQRSYEVADWATAVAVDTAVPVTMVAQHRVNPGMFLAVAQSAYKGLLHCWYWAHLAVACYRELMPKVPVMLVCHS